MEAKAGYYRCGQRFYKADDGAWWFCEVNGERVPQENLDRCVRSGVLIPENEGDPPDPIVFGYPVETVTLL